MLFECQLGANASMLLKSVDVIISSLRDHCHAVGSLLSISGNDLITLWPVVVEFKLP